MSGGANFCRMGGMCMYDAIVTECSCFILDISDLMQSSASYRVLQILIFSVIISQ